MYPLTIRHVTINKLTSKFMVTMWVSCLDAVPPIAKGLLQGFVTGLTAILLWSEYWSRSSFLAPSTLLATLCPLLPVTQHTVYSYNKTIVHFTQQSLYSQLMIINVEDIRQIYASNSYSQNNSWYNIQFQCPVSTGFMLTIGNPSYRSVISYAHSLIYYRFTQRSPYWGSMVSYRFIDPCQNAA